LSLFTNNELKIISHFRKYRIVWNLSNPKLPVIFLRVRPRCTKSDNVKMSLGGTCKPFRAGLQNGAWYWSWPKILLEGSNLLWSRYSSQTHKFIKGSSYYSVRVIFCRVQEASTRETVEVKIPLLQNCVAHLTPHR
jgi:hypothetical protein